MVASRTLIAIPCYNCAGQIKRVLEGLLRQDGVPGNPLIDILLIDNQSVDTTVEEIRRFQQENATRQTIGLWQNATNLGLGGTQKVAFQKAQQGGYEFLVILHGDDQASAHDLPKLFLRMKESQDCAAVLGSRFSRGSRRAGYSKVRTIGNMGLNLVYSLATGTRIEDLGSGLNLFRVESFDQKRLSSFSDQFTFNMDLLLYLVAENKRFCFEPISWTEFDQVSNARNLKVGWAALQALLKWRRPATPGADTT